jgi:hypothetical protein
VGRTGGAGRNSAPLCSNAPAGIRYRTRPGDAARRTRLRRGASVTGARGELKDRERPRFRCAIQLSQSRFRLRALAEELRNTGINPGHGSHTVGVLDCEQEV